MAISQATPLSHATKAGEDFPREVRDAVCGLAVAAGQANVIMQLARLPIGRGVAESTVDSGRVDKHPIKRLRTTLAYLTIAMLGTEEERRAFRNEVNRSHAPVRSRPSDPVAYNAFDPELQLWVAACLYKGAEDVYRLLYGPPSAERLEVMYQHGRRLGTTLQMRAEQWPRDRAAFEDYWNEGVAKIEMDDLTRAYLRGLADLSLVVKPLGRFGAPIVWVLGPVSRFVTLGFLPQPFRDQLGLAWDDRQQRAFDALMGAAAAVVVRLPRPLREFPFNVYLWDTRRRIRDGRPIV